MIRLSLKTALLWLLFIVPVAGWASDALWIDVRTAEEYAASHVPDAVNIPYEEITGRIEEVTTDKNALIYLYCRSGRRSGIARDALVKAGFSNVVNVGGLDEALKKSAELSSSE
jgi:phage shock protein E